MVRYGFLKVLRVPYGFLSFPIVTPFVFVWYYLWIPYGFPMVPYGFPMLCPWVPNGFRNGVPIVSPMVSSWVAEGFPMVGYSSPMVPQWSPYSFPMGFQWSPLLFL